MFGSRWRLFRIFGIPFYLDISWLVILALLTITMANTFSAEIPGLARINYWVMGFVAAIAFFVCILLHEMGHALVARSNGMPVKGITLFMFGGVAELGGEPASARSEFFMAIAGPCVSVVLALGFWLTSILGRQAGWSAPLVSILEYLALINVVVLMFNMVPAFPLDGGRVFRSILWGATGNLRRSTYWASLFGQMFAWFLIAMGVIEFFRGHLWNGVWIGLIGWFLRHAAQGSYQEVLIRQALQGEKVRVFMNPEPVVVPPDLDLEHWVEDYVYRYHRKSFPVTANGHLEGLVTTRDLAKYPRDEWRRHTVSELMHTDLNAVSVAPDTEALDALKKMERTGSSRLLVAEGNHLVGIVSLKDLMRLLKLKLGFESETE